MQFLVQREKSRDMRALKVLFKSELDAENAVSSTKREVERYESFKSSV